MGSALFVIPIFLFIEVKCVQAQYKTLQDLILLKDIIKGVAMYVSGRQDEVIIFYNEYAGSTINNIAPEARTIPLNQQATWIIQEPIKYYFDMSYHPICINDAAKNKIPKVKFYTWDFFFLPALKSIG